MYLLFGIGGTHTRIGISSDHQTLEKSTKIHTAHDFDKALAEIKQSAYELLGHTWPDKVVIGVPGILDKDRHKLLISPNLTGWCKQDLYTNFSEIFKTEQITLANDAELEAIGEATEGAGKNKKIVAYIVVGTGVGGARVVDGKPDLTLFGQEPGHQLLTNDQTQTLEELEKMISGTAIKESFGQKAEDIQNPLVWQRISRRFAIGLHNTIVHWSPEIVVLGGSVSQHIDLQIVREVLDKTLKIYPEVPEIAQATLGDDAGLIGALHF